MDHFAYNSIGSYQVLLANEVIQRSRTHAVSLIENVRNLEFDNVMLAPDVFDSVDTTSKAAFKSV